VDPSIRGRSGWDKREGEKNTMRQESQRVYPSGNQGLWIDRISVYRRRVKKRDGNKSDSMAYKNPEKSGGLARRRDEKYDHFGLKRRAGEGGRVLAERQGGTS